MVVSKVVVSKVVVSKVVVSKVVVSKQIIVCSFRKSLGNNFVRVSGIYVYIHIVYPLLPSNM